MNPRLDSPDTYERALSVLIKKWSARNRLDQLEAHGVSLADLRSRNREFSSMLASTIKRREFRYSALTPTMANIDGKFRQLYRPNLVDAVVLAATASYLSAVADPMLSPALHSFRKGRSSPAVVRFLSQYFTNYRSRVPVRERGLYVLQRDIVSYGESIDNSPSSMLFTQVERALQNDPDPQHRDLARTLVHAAIMQPVFGHDGVEKPLECGVPTGSPIQPVCANLYLAELDARFDSVPGAFYSRFGDDLLFIHPDYEICDWAMKELSRQLSALKLRSKVEKERNIYLNGAGRASPRKVEFAPATCLEYLGFRVHFVGRLGLKRERERELCSQLLRRFQHVRAAAMTGDSLALAQLMCVAASKAFDPANPLAIRAAERLRYGVDDRDQLKQLDYRVALMIVETATGRRGPRAFRTVSYRKLRELGLTSLVLGRHRKRAVRSPP